MTKEKAAEKILLAIKVHGLGDVMYHLFGKRLNVKMAYSKKSCDTPVEELALSVRSFNALKRSGADTVGDVIDALADGSIRKVRHLGIKSLVEIQLKVLELGYESLTDRERKEFIIDVISRNCPV